MGIDVSNHKTFKNYFGELEGERLKTAPRGFPKDHPEIELLKFKSYIAVHNLKNNEALSDSYLQHATKVLL